MCVSFICPCLATALPKTVDPDPVLEVVVDQEEAVFGQVNVRRPPDGVVKAHLTPEVTLHIKHLKTVNEENLGSGEMQVMYIN